MTTGRILRGGVPWRATGVNIFQLINNDYPSNAGRINSHSEITSLLNKTVSLKAGLVRAHTLAIGVGSSPGALVKGISGTNTPVITYNSDVQDAIDWAISEGSRLGLYFMVTFFDALNYYHGSISNWVNFRYPGTCSTDPSVKPANSTTQRTAQRKFFQDAQCILDAKTYIYDWFNHTNSYTGRKNKDEPAVAIAQAGNELWMVPQDVPAWMTTINQHFKAVAPQILVADGASADYVPMANMNSTSDIWCTHPYSGFTNAQIQQQAADAKTAGKAYMLDEYPWSKTLAPDFEASIRAATNGFSTMPWSLQNDADLHNNGAAYGTDDNSLYYPGKDSTQTAAVTRLRAHADGMMI